MAFASTSDVAKRRGLSSLPPEDETAAGFLLEAAQTVIEEAVGLDEDAIKERKGAVPKILKFLSVEKVLKAMANPSGLASQSETLGAHSHTERFNSTDNTDLLLSKIEERMVRKAVWGKLTGTVRVSSAVADVGAGS